MLTWPCCPNPQQAGQPFESIAQVWAPPHESSFHLTFLSASGTLVRLRVSKPQQSIFPCPSNAHEWLSAAQACTNVPCFSLGNFETRPNLIAWQIFGRVVLNKQNGNNVIIQEILCHTHLSSPQHTIVPPDILVVFLLAYTAHACILLKETDSQTLLFPTRAFEMLPEMIGLFLSPQQTRFCGSCFVHPQVVVHPAYLHKCYLRRSPTYSGAKRIHTPSPKQP